MISRYEQFSNVISNICRSVQKIERDEMVKYGYKGAYAQYLMALKRNPEGLTSVQLSEKCDKDKAAVSRMVSEMESKHLIVRENDKDNAYRARLVLTEEGEKVAEYVYQRGARAVEEVGKGLSDEKRRILYEVLELLSTNLEKVCNEGLPE